MEADTPPARRRRLFGRKDPAPVTVVFSHGYCLNQDSWHFQRAALRGLVRTVHWDQRSHGRSGQGVAQSGPDGVPVTIDQLGRDLKAVLDVAAPEGPLVLVGHSMGGMTIMALAERYPEFVRDRVVGVAFVGTSAGKLGEVSYGLPIMRRQCRPAGPARSAEGARLPGGAGRAGPHGRPRTCSPG